MQGPAEEVDLLDRLNALHQERLQVELLIAFLESILVGIPDARNVLAVNQRELAFALGDQAVLFPGRMSRSPS